MNNHIQNVCRIGRLNRCCRYLVVGSNGFECMKLDLEMKRILDIRVVTMTAQADNCDGQTKEILNKKES